MSDIERTLDAVFFRTDAGNEPVREWLQTLSKAERKLIGADILTSAILLAHRQTACWQPGPRALGGQEPTWRTDCKGDFLPRRPCHGAVARFYQENTENGTP